MADVIVNKSKIDGNGVFANRDFKKGEMVVEWDILRMLTKEEFKKLPKGEKKYCSMVDGMYVLIASPARFVNHSCNANTFAENKRDIALRDIKKGEEITGNYVGEGVPMDFKCNCGSENCVGLVADY